MASFAPRGRSAPRSRPWASGTVLRLLQGLAAALVTTAILGVAVLYLRLAEGPIDLAPFRGVIERNAADALDGGSVDIGSVSLVLGESGARRPAILLSDVRARDAAGDGLFHAPRVRIALRPLDLLLGLLRPTLVAIAGAEATLRRYDDGRFGFGVGAADDGADSPTALGLGAALAAALDRSADGPLASLDRVTLEDAVLVYEDAISGRVWRGLDAALSMRRDVTGLRVEAALVIPDGAHGSLRLAAEGARTHDGGATMRLRFENAAATDLADQIPALDAFRVLDAPLAGEASVAIDGAGRLLAFEGAMRAGRGAIVTPDRSVRVDGADFDFALDPVTGRYGVRRAALMTALGSASGAGFIDIARDDAGRPVSAIAQIELDGLTIADPSLFDAPAAFDGGRLVGRASFTPLTIEIGEAHLSRGTFRLDASGRAEQLEAGWSASLTATGRDAGLGDILALWPRQAAPGARAWIAENLEAGRIDRFELWGRTGPAGDGVSLSFAFRDATGHYFRPLPPITGGRGWGQVDTTSFALTLEEGVVTAPGGGVIRLDGSSMSLPDLDDPRSVSAISVVGEGPVAAILEVLDFEPLGFPGKLGLDPASTAGRARARASLSVPLLADVSLEDVGVGVDATLADVAVSLPTLPREIRVPALALSASTTGLRASGEGRFGIDPLAFSWVETFSPAPGEPSSRFEVEADLTPALAADFGVDAAGVLEGRAPATASIERWTGGDLAFEAQFDLGPAALTIDALDWRKEAGWKGSGRAEGRLEGGALRLDRFAITAPGLDAEGALRLGADGALRRLALDRFRFLETTDIALTVEAEAGRYAVTATGRTLDLRSVESAGGEDGGGSGAGDAGPTLSVALGVERLQVDDTLFLAPASGRVEIRPGQGFDGSIEGRIGGQSAAAIALAPDGAATRATVTSDDAGGVLRNGGFFAGGFGGSLTVEAILPAEGAAPIEGGAEIRGMTVVRDPGLQRLLAQADLAEAETRLREDGIDFDRIDARFVLEPERLRLKEVVAAGPLIGLTVEGEVDTARGSVAMEGVFTPLYALNSAIGAIPLLGDLLTGGKGQGIFGFTFTLTGPASDPEASVNPLSIIAPGVLRQLFGGGGGGGGEPRPAPERRGRD